MFNKRCGLFGFVLLIVATGSQAEEKDYQLSPFLGHKEGYQLPTNAPQNSAPKGSMLGVFAGLELSRSYSWDIGFQQRNDLQTINDARTSVFESAVKYDYKLQSNYSIYGRLGAAYWDMDTTNTHLKGVSPMAELGVSYWFPKNFRISGGYQYIDDIANYNSHMLLVSAAFTFGAANRPIPSAEEVINQYELEPVVAKTSTVLQKPTNAIYFDTDSYAIDGEWVVEKKAQRIICLLRKYRESKVDLIGHTDAEGTADYNQVLSENRAQAVANWLMTKDIAQEQISLQGVGDTQPVSSNLTPESRALNRRVEMELRGIKDNEMCE